MAVTPRPDDLPGEADRDLIGYKDQRHAPRRFALLLSSALRAGHATSAAAGGGPNGRSFGEEKLQLEASFRRHGLYDPYFHVRDDRWLKVAALYWPKLFKAPNVCLRCSPASNSRGWCHATRRAIARGCVEVTERM